MRIAVIGNGRSVHALSRAAAVGSLGHDVRFVTIGPVLGDPPLPVHSRPLPRSPAQAVAALAGFRRDLAGFRPDLIHLHYAGGRLGSLATLLGARPLVATVMGGDVQEDQHPGGLSRWQRRATLRVLERADALLVKSEALKAMLRTWGDFEAKARVVRWGVDPVVFRRDAEAARRLRERLSLAADDRVILSPRLLSPLYGVHLLAEALPGVLRREPRAVLLVTEYQADAAYRARLIEGARAAGCAERLRLVGEVAATDMPAYYSLAEVVAMVPLSDGLPQSLFEAMACEVPVVLGDLPAYREVVGDGECARLVARDSAAIAAALCELLADAPRARGLAVQARRRVEEVAWLPRELRRVQEVYAEVVTAAARRRSGGDGLREWGRRVLDLAALARGA